MQQGLNLISIELSFDDSFELSDSDAERVIRIKGDKTNIMWQKERLFNLALKELPKNCDKIIFIDNDIVFQNFDWIKETNKELENYILVQPFKYRYFLDSSFRINFNSVYQSAASYLNENNSFSFNLFKSKTPGYCLAIRREAIYTKIYDKAILGGGDALFFCAYLDTSKKNKKELIKHAVNRNIRSHYLKNCQINDKFKNSVGFVNGEILHLWHGKSINRKYLERYSLFLNKAEIKDFSLDKQNLYYWKNKILLKNVKEYFKLRKEDINFKNKILNFANEFLYKIRQKISSHKLTINTLNKHISASDLSKELLKPSEISVLITIRNRSDYKLTNLLKSLKWQDYPKKIDIKLIDYGSNNKNRKIIKNIVSQYAADYIYIDNKDTFSRAKALNILLKEVKTKYILFADSDIIFKNNYISELIKNLDKNPFQIICNEMKDLPRGLVNNIIKEYEYERLENIAIFRGGLKLSSSGYHFGKGMNAGLSYFYKLIGGYDENYIGWGCEDDDLIKRLNLIGIKTSYNILKNSSYLHQWHKKYSVDGLTDQEVFNLIDKNKKYLYSTNTIFRNGKDILN